MKEGYITPEIEIIRFENEDIITTSNIQTDEDELDIIINE